ncbi:hypothetical protein Hypma_014901 [Hypsizygus marmoreus]|uniref:DUF7918 domain-containing protein n=1 Tax=Hypsizygus marmoreus TaxID=39966 RepID=A0A369K3C5_HYPMA|nr:hypothetical protein Hypma_014901 [Hypsizygus marmoreus]
MFSSLEVTDDDEALGARDVDALGNIELRIRNVEESAEQIDFSPLQVDKSERIHERSGKGMTQQVKFGDEESIDEIEWVDELDFIERLVTFISKYRSIEKIGGGPNNCLWSCV